MEFRNSIKTLNYARKMLTGDTEHILPFPVQPQKPASSGKRPVPLARCAPREAGVSCQALDEFLRALSAAPNGFPHTCLVARRDQIICEAAWAPYSTEIWHVTHSLCKSFTGTAIGLLWDEGKIDLDETVCSIFPEKCGLMTSRKARSVTIRHLLTMSSGSAFRETGAVVESDWVRAFLESEFEFEPGAHMDYNSMNSYLLSAVVKRKAGCGMLEYLRVRLFEPMGFGDVAWEKSPDGVEKGGWGMYVYLEDALKLGLLYLHKGMWKGRRLLSETWVDMATTTYMQRESGEEYGYHIWTDSANHLFLFNGMFGQYVMVCPSLELVIALNAGASNLFTHSAALRAALQFLERVRSEPLPKEKDDRALAFTLAHLNCGHPVPNAPTFSLRDLFHSWVRPNSSTDDAEVSLLPLGPDDVVTFSQNRVSLLPLVPSCMNDWYSAGSEKCQLENGPNGLSLLWWESGQVYTLPIGFSRARPCNLAFGGNFFQAAVRGKVVLNEDEEPVLKLTIYYLELSSVRVLKFFFHRDRPWEVRLTETPGIHLLFETLEKNVPASVRSKMDLFRDMDYLWYRMGKLCTPTLTGSVLKTSNLEKRGKYHERQFLFGTFHRTRF